MNIKNLSLEEKIGQMLMIGLKDKNIDDVSSLIENNYIGGVILYKKDYNTYCNMVKYINNIKKINSKNKIPIFISIDQEGGRVNRMPSDIINFKPAFDFAEKKDILLIEEQGKIMGQMLNCSGINMNYAPILDIKNFPKNHAIGDRCYGSNIEDVSKNGIKIMKELQNKNIISVIKHFPGHGLTKKDSHFQNPKITESLNEIENTHMIPFEKAIKSGADAVMVSHLCIKDIDKKNPSSLSKKVINKFLIEKFKFRGLIITDDLKMITRPFHINYKKVVKKAINAGNDIIMLGYSYKMVEKIIKYIKTEIQKGRIKIEKIDKSVEKIISIKEKYNITDNYLDGFNIDEINEKIKKLNNKVERM